MTTPWSSMWKRIEEIEAMQAETTLDDERWEIVEPEPDDAEEGGDRA